MSDIIVGLSFAIPVLILRAVAIKWPPKSFQELAEEELKKHPERRGL